MLKPQIRTFVTVCRTGSFSAAAAALFITPSAVIQQINGLEESLGVKLLDRTRKGIRMTRAGEYLYGQAKEMLEKNDQIIEHLHRMETSGHEIRVATSLMDKCRLLYDLWMLFCEQEKGYQVKMETIGSDRIIPPDADLVESIDGHPPWLKDWNFYEVCRVPFCFAFSPDHPLAAKDELSLEDLRGQTVIVFDQGTAQMLTQMLEELKAHGAVLKYQEQYSMSSVWECSFNHEVLLAPSCWNDILINMTMRPCQWKYDIPYGFFYRKKPTPAAEKFMNFIRNTYEDDSEDAIVPVF